MNTKLFLSLVSKEFRAYRELLASDLKRPTLDIAVQEDFITAGGSTLVKLDTYIRACDGVIHVIGHATGSVPPEQAVKELCALYPDLAKRLPALADALAKPQPGFSYTQWEAYLAIYHARPLFVYRPSDFDLAVLNVPRGKDFIFSNTEAQSQREHYQRICALGHDRGQFATEERLSSAVLRDLVEILPRLEAKIIVPPTRLPAATQRLIGRDDELALLDAAWNDSTKNIIVVRAFGGMGKTSLITTWMATMEVNGWPGAEQVFDWTFYSQGTRDQRHASSDLFFEAAFEAFANGEKLPADPWRRGERLAHHVGSKRCLLVLDGLEPLQDPPKATNGKLRDRGIESLLKGLAARNAGLCIVTTRERIPDIERSYGRTAEDIDLQQLTDLAGAALLHHRGVKRAGAKAIAPDDPELRAASRSVHGHGLTLHLIGHYLRLVEHGDIRKLDTIRLADADREYQNDATRPYGHAFKAMEAYEHWFATSGAQGERMAAILRLLGLFDRAASKSCLEALRAKPAIPGLTEPLVDLSPRDWQLTISRLGEIDLVKEESDDSLECHPLLREYFAMRVKSIAPEQSSPLAPREEHSATAANEAPSNAEPTPDAKHKAHLAERDGYSWREAHRRLFENLCTTTKEGAQPTLRDLEPLYQAIVHGCQAGLQQRALDEILWNRIRRGQHAYSIKQLGAFGSDISAIANFFESPWSRVSRTFSKTDQTYLLNASGFALRSLGRLNDAIEPIKLSLAICVELQNWKEAAIRAINLSELELTMGNVPSASTVASQAVIYGDRSYDSSWRSVTRAMLGDALHQMGRRAEAGVAFSEAEEIQKSYQPAYSWLYSVRGFQYCNLLLAVAERAAWRVLLGLRCPNNEQFITRLNESTELENEHPRSESASLGNVSNRATQTLEWAKQASVDIISEALDQLTLCCAALYSFVLEQSHIPNLQSHIELALCRLRAAGQLQEVPRGLLTRAMHRALYCTRIGPDSAQSDLDEAWDIAERGSMKLHLIDIHLHRARLFFREADYPWQSPQHDLAEARRMIAETGYHRRDEELADAEAVILR